MNSLLLMGLFIGSSFGDPTGTIIPCKKGDSACINASAKAAFGRVIEGFPELGVERSDPLILGEIVGDLSTLKYKFTNSSAIGLSHCDMENVVFDLDTSKIGLNLICHDLIMHGHYKITGRLLILPVEGEGTYEIKAKRYVFKLNGELKQVQGGDGKQHVTVKNVKFTSEVQENVHYDFDNLFNGNKELANAVLTFANANWKEVADFVQEPVVAALITKAVKHLNKYFKLLTVDELYIP